MFTFSLRLQLALFWRSLLQFSGFSNASKIVRPYIYAAFLLVANVLSQATLKFATCLPRFLATLVFDFCVSLFRVSWKRACVRGRKLVQNPTIGRVLYLLGPQLTAFLTGALDCSYSLNQWIRCSLLVLQDVEHTFSDSDAKHCGGSLVRPTMTTSHKRSWKTHSIQRDPFASAYTCATAISATPPELTTRRQAVLPHSIRIPLVHLFTPPTTPDNEDARGPDPRKPCSLVTEVSSPTTTLHSFPTTRGNPPPTSLCVYHTPDDDLLASFERTDAFISTLTLDEKIGEGSYGLIYCGSGIEGRPLAIKLMKKTGDAEQDGVFQEEIDAMERAVESKWAVKLKYWRCSETHVLIAMSLFSGGNLYDYAKTQRTFEPDLAIFWTAEILLGLHSLHTLGIIHRDVKPENVMLDSFGHIKIIDFGLAKLFDHNLVSREDYPLFHSLRKTGGDLFPQIWALDSNPHTTTEPFGTQGFAPPELWQRRQYSFGVDYFAMSCVLYELLTGRLPFAYDTTTDNYDVMNIIVDPDETLPDVQRDFLRKALAPNPVLRPSVSHMKKHPLFMDIDWHALARCELDPPISF